MESLHSKQREYVHEASSYPYCIYDCLRTRVDKRERNDSRTICQEKDAEKPEISADYCNFKAQENTAVEESKLLKVRSLFIEFATLHSNRFTTFTIDFCTDAFVKWPKWGP